MYVKRISTCARNRKLSARMHSQGVSRTNTNSATQIKDAVGNEYGKPKDVAGEKRMAFTSLADTAFDVCFTNTATGRCMFVKPGDAVVY